MYGLVEENVKAAFDSVLKGKSDEFENIYNREEYIDYLNAEISKYIAKVVVMEMPEKDSRKISSYYRIVGNLERIGDHAMNIAEYAKALEKTDGELSKSAVQEIKDMRQLSLDALKELEDAYEKDGAELLKTTAMNEQRIDDMSESLRENQLDRMRKGVCSADVGILFSEMVTDFERIGDHAMNIAEEYNGI